MFFGMGHVGRLGIAAKPSTTLAAGNPTLSLDFMTGTLDPSLTFTRASTATYFDATGTMQTAASGAPRFDYDPATHALRGLLIEEARQNIWLQSADASNAAWLKANITSGNPVVTANQATAPDGTLTAARVVYPAVSGAGNASLVYQAPIVTAAAYTFSIYLRGNVGGEQLYIGWNNGSVFASAARITLTTAWQRYSFTTGTLTATSWVFMIGTDLRDGTQTSTTGSTVYMWGGQLEAAAFQTSYVATTAAAVTRAVDVATMPTTGWLGATTGSLATDFMLRQIAPAGINIEITSLGTDTNNLARLLNGAGAGSVSQQVFQASTNRLTLATANNLIPGVAQKAAITYDTGSLAGSVVLNGGTVASGIASAAYPALGTLFLGGGRGSPISGYISRVRYWPRVLSDAEMQSVTT